MNINGLYSCICNFPLEYVTPYITIKNPLGYSLYPRGKITICVFGLLQGWKHIESGQKEAVHANYITKSKRIFKSIKIRLLFLSFITPAFYHFIFLNYRENQACSKSPFDNFSIKNFCILSLFQSSILKMLSEYSSNIFSISSSVFLQEKPT